ncbi:glycosyltransferase (Group 1) [Pseudorhizobium banfieldiae]|uniref:Glycosyltransferase (Group 1) n=1 Tax=Pseudorhizobium banfieldiae TaxID=1125847 RepID=L0NKP1_9HYPH|nr:glycosyltransferase family 4 protein [Pseudorhizobium banfieldiae]CAD6617820.1 glycosyltransferase WbuB [arsenite-oxidising bacterium NT-25]CCF20877.1 glycosyltransferase (Group 1) [Pseudorhizobium banfieldiae]
MRILILTQYFWPENFRINDLASDMIARGHEVTILTGLPNYPSGKVFGEYRSSPQEFARFNGAEVIRIPMLSRGKGSLRLIANYASFVLSGLTVGAWRLRGRRFDSIFVFMISPITAVLPAILQRRLKRAPLFVWILDLWPDTLEAVGAVKSPRLLALVGRLVSYIYRRTDHILVQSRSFMDNVRTYAGKDATVSYFPGWAEPIFQQGAKEIAKASEVLRYADSFNVLFAGNVGDAQDFPAILDAAEALRSDAKVRILVVGDGRMRPWVENEIERRGLSDRVILLGRFPLERMPSFFTTADALLVSLKREKIFAMTIPGKVQSYLAAGVPLVGMLDGEGARVIEEAGAGVVSPSGDGAALARNIEALAAMPPKDRAAMGANARTYGLAEFDRTQLLDGLEAKMRNAGMGSEA